MTWVDTENAATRLGVTRQRVVQLLRDGALSGRRVGAVWLVDAESVSRRMLTNGGRGRPWDEDLVWEILRALSGDTDAISREAARRIEASDAHRLTRALGGAISVTRYDSALDASPLLVPTGVTAIDAIDAGLMSDDRVMHGYPRGGPAWREAERDLLPDAGGDLAVHRFRSGEERVQDRTPRALIAVDCGGELSSRVRAAGLDALSVMRAAWLTRRTA